MHSSEIRRVRFPKTRPVLWGMSVEGYATGDVDGFVAQCAQALEAHEAGQPASLLSNEIIVKNFRDVRVGGAYDIAAVDEFLDRVALALREYEQPTP